MRSRILILALAVAWPAAAHETWLNAVVPARTPAPAPPPAKGKPARRPPASLPAGLVSGDGGLVELCTGGRYPVSDSAVTPDRIDRTYLRLGLGSVWPLTGARDEGTLTRLDATYAGSGVAALAVAIKPRFLEIPPADFEAYLAEVGATAALEERKKRKETKKPGREVYAKFPKTYVGVADPAGKPKKDEDAAAAATPLGLPLELIVAGDPRALRTGDTLAASLLLDGRPLGGHTVRVFDAGGASRSASTDAGGRLTLPLHAEGRLLLAATHLRRTTKDDRRKGDIYKKADWESVWASLQLEVRAAAPPSPTPPRPPRKKRR